MGCAELEASCCLFKYKFDKAELSDESNVMSLVTINFAVKKLVEPCI